MQPRYGVVVNPTANKGAGRVVGPRVLARLAASGSPVVDLSGPDAASALRRARAAVDGGEIDTLVVVGGDGAAHLGTAVAAGRGIRLGLVAAGTGNDSARELGLPVGDPGAAVDRILAGRTRTIDAVRVDRDPGAPGPELARQWFLGVCAAGFDAIVNERANRLSWPRGRSRYNLAILRELPVFRAIPYAVIVDGVRVESEAMLVAVGNGPAYGGGMQVTPHARYDDGLADVLVLGRISTAEFLRVYPRVYAGTHVRHPAVTIRRGRQIRLEAEGIVAYADGERLAPLPLTLTVVPGALTVLA